MHIFFDLDGTLIDTLPDISNAVNKALKLNNLKEISIDKVRLCIGHGSTNLMIKASNNKFNNKLLNDYLNIYHNNLTNLSKPYPNTVEVLNELKVKGYKLGVYSNKDSKDVIKIINYYFPNIFDFIIGKNINFPLKPDPSLMLNLIKENNIDKNKLIYVGDMETDYNLAKNLGIKFIYASYGYNNDNLIVINNIINEFKDIVSCLTNLV